MIPYTTRPRRADGDRDDGFVFISCEVFEEMIRREEFLEYANVFGHYYGTPAKCVQRAKECGQDMIIRIDDRGLAQIKQKIHDVISILILPGKSAEVHHGLRLPPPNSDEYDHVLTGNRVEESADRLVEFVRSIQLRRS